MKNIGISAQLHFQKICFPFASIYEIQGIGFFSGIYFDGKCFPFRRLRKRKRFFWTKKKTRNGEFSFLHDLRAFPGWEIINLKGWIRLKIVIIRTWIIWSILISFKFFWNIGNISKRKAVGWICFIRCLILFI